MSHDLGDPSVLLAAASQTTDRAARIAYLAEARVQLARARESQEQQLALLTAMEHAIGLTGGHA